MPMKNEKKEKIKFYKFTYLFVLIGPRKILASKNSWDLWVSIVMVITISLNQKFLNNYYTFIGNSAIISATLLGLIIASYAIVASLSDEKLLLPLVQSGFYQYSIFQFTWSAIWLFISLIISLLEIALQFKFDPIIIFSAFALIYGFFGSFISIFRALHDLSIMNARKNQPLKDAWSKFEKRKEHKEEKE